MPTDWIALATIVAGIASVLAIVVAVAAWRKADLNASATTLIQLNAEIRQLSRDLLQASAMEYGDRLIEFFQVIEIGCALCNENLIKGEARNLVVTYLRALLYQVMEDPRSAKMLIHEKEQHPGSYRNIALFRATR